VDARGRTEREGALVVRQAVWVVTGAAGRPLRLCRPGGIDPRTTQRAAERGRAVECFIWNALLVLEQYAAQLGLAAGLEDGEHAVAS
jgi:hypothetical protein